MDGKQRSSEETARRLHSAAIHLLRRLRREDAGTGLSAPRLSALSVVVFSGPIAMSALAVAEQVQPPTMTRLVQALEEMGLVRRVADAGDARSLLVEATAKGRALLESGRERRIKALEKAMSYLSPEELMDLERGVEQIERVLRRI